MLKWCEKESPCRYRTSGQTPTLRVRSSLSNSPERLRLRMSLHHQVTHRCDFQVQITGPSKNSHQSKMTGRDSLSLKTLEKTINTKLWKVSMRFKRWNHMEVKLETRAKWWPLEFKTVKMSKTINRIITQAMGSWARLNPREMKMVRTCLMRLASQRLKTRMPLTSERPRWNSLNSELDRS